MKTNLRIIFFILSFSLIACEQQKKKADSRESQESVIEVVDKEGNIIKINKVPERAVCLFDPSVDIISMLQTQDKLVGVPAEIYHDDELYNYFKFIDNRIASKELATPGTNESINLESVISLNPDLIIAHNLPPTIIQTLNGMGDRCI